MNPSVQHDNQAHQTRVKRRVSGPVIPHPPRWYHGLAAWLVYGVVRAVSATLRYRWTDTSGHFAQPPAEQAIYCIWHNRLALCMPGYRYLRPKMKTAGMAAMVSASKDGGFLTAVLKRFRVQPVRGSSSRRGPQALLELITWSERGYDLAITPDGPRGPRYIVQGGVMSLAQITGLPIVPFSFSADWKIVAKSWDRFQIPLPFSRCEMNLGAPVRVPRDATDEQRERLRQQLEGTLKSLARD